MSVLDSIKDADYRIGDLQVTFYDRNNPAWGENYISDLYFALGAGRRTLFRRENLQMLFCGMTDLSLPAIIGYLNQQRLVIMGKWEGQIFRTGGVCWVSFLNGFEEKTGFGGYGFLRWMWGTEEQQVLSMLGLAFLFNEFKLIQLHTQRYADNIVSGNYLKQFGFQDLATIPRFMLRGKSLVSGVLSTLSREELEINCAKRILAATLE